MNIPINQNNNEFEVHTDPNIFYDEFRIVRDKIINEYTIDINCFKFYQELKKEYPNAVAFYDGDHILTMINGSLYDKTGCKMYNFYAYEPKRYAEAQTGAWGIINK